jgi:copper chaperone CopZ
VAAALQSLPAVEWVTISPDAQEVTVLRRAGEHCDSELVRAAQRVGVTARLIPTATLRLSVTGIEKEADRRRCSRTLLKVPGTRSVRVAQGKGDATVVYEKGVTSDTAILAALKKAGFEASRQS